MISKHVSRSKDLGEHTQHSICVDIMQTFIQPRLQTSCVAWKKGKLMETETSSGSPFSKKLFHSFCGFCLSQLCLFTPALALHSWVESQKPKENDDPSVSYCGQRALLLRPYHLTGAAWLVPRQAVLLPQASFWNFNAAFSETTPSGTDFVLCRRRHITAGISTFSQSLLPLKEASINLLQSHLGHKGSKMISFHGLTNACPVLIYSRTALLDYL